MDKKYVFISGFRPKNIKPLKKDFKL